MTRVVVALGALMLAANLCVAVLFPRSASRAIFGDAMGHFVQLRSIVYDRDLDFSNEYTRLYLAEHPNEPAPDWHELLPTPTGMVRTYAPIGPVLLWAPLYLIASALMAGAAVAGWAAPPDGFERALQLVPNVIGVALATAGVWLSWRLASRLLDLASAGAGVLAIWLGSNAIYYTLVSPSYSHVLSMFATSVLMTHWLAPRGRWTWRQAAVSGMLAGLAALIRWGDVLWLAVPAIESMRAPGRTTDRLAGVAAAGLACLLVFSPQMAVWHVLYGSPLTVPQGGSFMEWTSPNGLAVLIAAKHGLFSWSPILVPAVIGLVPLMWRQRRLLLPLSVVAIGSWYVNASAADWWAGEAFGARRFLSLFPVFALGLAAWLQPSMQAGRRGRLVAASFLVAANLLFLFQYQVFMRGWRDIAPYPDESLVNLWLMRFVVPFRVLARWMG